eukprot:FR739096.1.p1 GENE.FR739096.1~~FR739096.1.p1  ORF type:complete len:209 (+),score=36.25 FR739096.1:91-627(+)
MGDRVRLVFEVASRFLMGVRAALQNETRGTAVVNARWLRYSKVDRGAGASGNDKGKLISSAQGVATSYGLAMIEARGILFVEPGDEMYEGMIIGEHSRPGDLDVNPTKGKKLTNVRASGTDEAVRLSPPRKYGIEEYITYMGLDEVLEVTPNGIRLRKAILDSSLRAKANKGKKAPKP